MFSPIAACALLLIVVPWCAARECRTPGERVATEPSESTFDRPSHELFGINGDVEDLVIRGTRSVGEETLWIFDADFEDLSGDNLGWVSYDMSGTIEHVNYWHKDTIHINGYEWLGDTTWWCGTYNECWRQPRGYGNDWICILERKFPEVAAFTEPGDEVIFKWDQRYALEQEYDYGYIDISDDGGESWTTIETWTNYGFSGMPGRSTDWDTSCYCHQPHRWHDLSEYAGQEVSLRFRCESDCCYSSQDMWNNPPLNSCLDGAWQLDNFEWTVNGSTFWYDDCESAGDNGWVHDNLPASGQTGVVFERVYDPDPLRVCAIPPGRWWMAALDAETGRMVDDQDTWLISPPIDISGAEGLVAYWESWVDCPRLTEDIYNLEIASDEQFECVQDMTAFHDEAPGWWYGGPGWYRVFDTWDAYVGDEWLAIAWRLKNNDPPAEPHMTGFMLDRHRVGVRIGGPPTVWNYSIWDRFHDTFVLEEALSDTATITITDGDGIVSARMLVSDDGGQTWDEHTIVRQWPGGDTWTIPTPADHIAEGTEVRYYFEATDGAGNVRTHPKTAPQTYYEFSVLPINGSVEEPCVLLVDKHGNLTHSEDRHATRMSEAFYREALDILGYEYDVFDVNVPSGSVFSHGPDSAGMKYYDTQIWFANEFSAYALRASDQLNLIGWLSQAEEGKERNLLLTGNDIGHWLIETVTETLDFYATWLASEYVQDDPGDSFPDTMPTLQDASGGFDFMTYDDRFCHLWSDW
jgi:hypothetical protein